MPNIFQSFRSVLLNAGMIVLGRIFGALISMLLYYFIANYSGPEMIGLIGLVGSIAILIGMIGTFGFHISILRFIPEYEVKFSKKAALSILDNILMFVTIFSTILAIFFLLSSNLFINLLENQFISHSSLIFIICILIVIKPIVMVLGGALRALDFNKFFAFFQLLTPLTNLIFFFILLSFLPKSGPLYALSISFIFTSIIAFFVIKYDAFKKNVVKEINTFNALNEIPKTFKISLPILLGAYAGIIASEGGVIILSSTSTQAEVGLYVIALKISLLSSLAMKALNAVLAPKISHLFSLNRIDDMFAVSRFITFISTLLSLIVIVFFYFFGQVLIVEVFGKSFVGANTILLFLLIAQFINSSTGPKGELMQMTGDEKKYRNITYVGAIFYLISNIFLIPIFGGVGAALSLMIAEFTWSFLSLLAIYKRFKILPLIKISELPLVIRSLIKPNARL